MDTKESIASLEEEIKTLQATIVESDKNVADATAQRQDENAAYKTLMSENTAASELIKMARNRMNKFYNPSQYKAPPKRELSREDRIAENMGGAALADVGAKPGPAPETWEGGYKKKGEESAGVIALIDMLVADVEKENQEMQVE